MEEKKQRERQREENKRLTVRGVAVGALLCVRCARRCVPRATKSSSWPARTAVVYSILILLLSSAPDSAISVLSLIVFRSLLLSLHRFQVASISYRSDTMLVRFAEANCVSWKELSRRGSIPVTPSNLLSRCPNSVSTADLLPPALLLCLPLIDTCVCSSMAFSRLQPVQSTLSYLFSDSLLFLSVFHPMTAIGVDGDQPLHRIARQCL